MFLGYLGVMGVFDRLAHIGAKCPCNGNTLSMHPINLFRAIARFLSEVLVGLVGGGVGLEKPQSALAGEGRRTMNVRLFQFWRLTPILHFTQSTVKLSMILPCLCRINIL